MLPKWETRTEEKRQESKLSSPHWIKFIVVKIFFLNMQVVHKKEFRTHLERGGKKKGRDVLF